LNGLSTAGLFSWEAWVMHFLHADNLNPPIALQFNHRAARLTE